MNATLTVRPETTQPARTRVELAVAKPMPEQRKARMPEATQPAEAAPRYDFVGIAG
ncbi:hypothetical protein [Marinobacterium aestuariivivens]|uniref:Uncharacterized protein n=1 Tax=Marinobacterium aestuariivivens TaxID=1698799 RepID=A0ABW2A0P0_9GAMM